MEIRRHGNIVTIELSEGKSIRFLVSKNWVSLSAEDPDAQCLQVSVLNRDEGKTDCGLQEMVQIHVFERDDALPDERVNADTVGYKGGMVDEIPLVDCCYSRGVIEAIGEEGMRGE